MKVTKKLDPGAKKRYDMTWGKTKKGTRSRDAFTNFRSSCSSCTPDGSYLEHVIPFLAEIHGVFIDGTTNTFS